MKCTCGYTTENNTSFANHKRFCGTKIKLICIHCGKEFETIPYHAKHGRKYCSRSCNIADHNTTRQWKQLSKDKISKANKGHLAGSNNPNWQGGGIKFKCNECGKEFTLAKNMLAKQKGLFCSNECDLKSRSKYSMPKYQRRIHQNMGKAIHTAIKSEKNGQSWEKILGYNTKQLMDHLESKFVNGMTWDNYGKKGWHIDHIKPLSSFTYNSSTDLAFIICWSLDNLQPLWEHDNIIKGGYKPYNKLKPMKT